MKNALLFLRRWRDRLLKSPRPQPYPGDPAPPGIQNRAISIRQPYIEMILLGEKTIEYRSQPTRIRGRVYLYASQTPGEREDFADLGIEPNALPRGVLVGTVEVISCIGVPGDYEWHLANPQRLDPPLKPENRAQPVWFRPFREPTT